MLGQFTLHTKCGTGKSSAIYKHARRFVCMVLGERIRFKMWTAEGFLTLTGIRRGELMGKYSLDWKRPPCISTVLHLGARCVNGSLGSLAQYLGSRAEREMFRDCRCVRAACILGPSSKLSPYLLMCPMAVLTVTRGPPSSERRTYGGMMQSSSNTCSTSNSLTSTDLEHLFLKICSQVNLA